MSGAVLEVTEATFDEVVGVSAVPVVVEFGAPWCPPCRAMEPVLDVVARDTDGRVRVLKIDVDAHPEPARRYEVVSVPTLLVFVDGEIRRRLVGARSPGRLLAEIEEVTGPLNR